MSGKMKSYKDSPAYQRSDKIDPETGKKVYPLPFNKEKQDAVTSRSP